ncbi:MAG TPA: DNA polymerase III subunit gamma/tau [Bryobacteraceae bacterium]|nr:DNA polymerase III subunit gamma/tau [Bryobacteraceae bacterium]
MYQVIARKYRPQSFAALIGQEHVKTTLENAIAQGRIAHGYIFSGQRGTGKTTVARILARCLNCEKGPAAIPCGACASCREIAAGSGLDVIEIDAASNRGINEMRELRENVRFRPARDPYKIFIIDEAHQITPEAFNALLKTLEEPPEWVVFLLCTTEAHKIPVTIASRCQQFNFRSVDFNDLLARLEQIARLEGVEADREALSVLAQAGEGSVRDSLSALDQAIACCGTRLSASEVRALLGMFAAESLEQVAEALAAEDTRKMLEIVAGLDANGRSLPHFARELVRYFRNLLVVKIAGAPTRLVAASPAEQQRLLAAADRFSERDLTRFLKLSLDLFRDLQSSLQPRLHLEMGLLRLVHAGRLQTVEQALASLAGGGRENPVPANSILAASQAVSTAGASGDFRTRLRNVLLQSRRANLADAIEHSAVSESAHEVVFAVPKMYQIYLKGSEFEAAVQQAAGRPVRIAVKVDDSAPQPAPASPAAPAAQDEVAARALAHPEVQKFQELFPGSQVRKIRDLRENDL